MKGHYIVQFALVLIAASIVVGIIAPSIANQMPMA